MHHQNFFDMKNSFFALKAIAFVLFCGLFTQNLTAQNTNSLGTDEFPRSNVSMGVGPNIYLLWRRVDKNLTQSDTVKWGKVNTYASPTFNFNYDYAITNVFSLGLAIGYNRLGLEFNDLDYTSNDGETFIRGDLAAGLSRTSITIRPLFHYGRSEKVDMYSGLRVGGAIWTLKFTGDGEAKARDQFQKSLSGAFGRGATVVPNFGLTLFGINYYPITNLGFGGELNIGQPYSVAASVNFRF